MCKLWLWLTAGIVAVGSLHAEYRPPIFNFQVGVGYRHDNYRMEMQGFIPNALTDFRRSGRELWHFKWSEIEIVESSATLRYTTCLNYYFRFNADWGNIHNGDVHVNGFAQEPGSRPNPHSPSSSRHTFLHISRINGKANRGNVQDYSGAFGYQFRSNGRRMIITPLVGFSWHQQRLSLHHGKQIIDALDPFPVLGPIPDLHVHYKPRWYGGFIGVDMEVQVDIPCVLFYGTAEWHWAQFKSTNTWDFANTFVNKFNQTSHGHGLILNGGISYKLQCNVWITAFGTYRNFQARRGRHRTISIKNNLLFPSQTFGTFPAFDPNRRNQLERFKWNSWVAGIAFEYRY